MPSAPLNVVTIPVKEVVVAENRHILKINSSSWLYESIQLIGLRTPISVRARADGKYDLVAGRQRLLAMTRLNSTAIPAFVFDSSTPDRDIELWELSENLHRSDLDRLERAQLTNRYWKLEKEAKTAMVDSQSTAQETAEEVSGQVDQKPVKGGRPKSGVSQTARELNRPLKEVQRDIKIATLSPEAADAARQLNGKNGKPLSDNESALLAAVKETTPEGQIAVLESHTKPAKDAVTEQPAVITTTPTEPVIQARAPAQLPQVTLLDHAWDNATDEERLSFCEDVILPWIVKEPKRKDAARKLFEAMIQHHSRIADNHTAH